MLTCLNKKYYINNITLLIYFPFTIGDPDVRLDHVVDIPVRRTKHFSSSYVMLAAQEYNSLPPSVFSNTYNPNKVRLNRHLQRELIPW